MSRLLLTEKSNTSRYAIFFLFLVTISSVLVLINYYVHVVYNSRHNALKLISYGCDYCQSLQENFSDR